MRIQIPGHRFELSHLDGKGTQILQFVQRIPFHHPLEGTTNQEVLRAVISRVQHLNREVPWDGNAQIVHHLRMALVLHEARALIRHVEKHDYPVEDIVTDKDGHFKLTKGFELE